MAKILSITNKMVTLGMEDGSLKDVDLSGFNFMPVAGDEVELFESEGRVIVTKKEVVKTAAAPDGGIHLNVSNDNINANTNTAAVTGGVPMRRPVKKVVYCLLALFLGWLGAHKFYAGRTGTGILYLFFCWTGIPAILAVIDFIVGLFKATDGNGCFLYY